MSNRALKWIFFVGFLLLFAGIDVGVSWRSDGRWKGVTALVHDVTATGDQADRTAAAEKTDKQPAGASTQHHVDKRDHTQGVPFLILLALGMYALTSYVLASAFVTWLARPTPLTKPDIEKIGQLLQVANPSGSVEAAADLAEKPVQDHRALMSVLADPNQSASRAVRAILHRLSPRDLLSYESLEQALASGVQARWRSAVVGADQVESLGQMAAISGLASTVVGLVVASVHLESTTGVGLALSGALLKCFVGLLGRLGCVCASHEVYQGAREEEEAVLSALVPGGGTR